MFYIRQSVVTYYSLTLAGAYTHDRVRVVNEFRCYEANSKIEESEKAGSRQESNLAGFFTFLYFRLITFISSVRQDALSRVIVATLVDS